MRLSKPKSFGSTLATVLLLTGVVAILAFALAGTSITNLHLSYRSANSDSARDLAESTIAVGLDKVLQDRDFGKSRLSSDVVELPNLGSNAEGFLAFDPDTAEKMGLPYSTNNLDSDAAKPGALGRVVPSHSLHLVGKGLFHGSQKTVEAIFHVPKFPYVVATSGKCETSGETLIGAVDNVDELTDPKGINEDNLQPGNIVSNSAAGDALKFGPETRVTGDAKAAGGVELSSGAKVMGEIKPNSTTTDLPTYSVSSFDPVATGKLGVVHIAQSTAKSPVYEGWVRRDGDLYVSNGLHLDNGVLYVNGNLNVTGGVTGTGALLVNGETHISGRSHLSTDNLAAIVSNGGVTLDGVAGQESVFRGLVYTNQSLTAQDITLVGTLLVAGNGGSVTLKDSKIVYSPDSVAVNLKHKARTALNFVSPSGANPGTYLGTNKKDNSVGNKIRIYVAQDTDGTFLIYRDGTAESDALRVDTSQEAMTMIRAMVGGSAGSKSLQAFDNTTQPKLTDLLDGLENHTVAPEEEALDLLELDPSKMLGLADKIRLVMIREL